MGLPGHPGQNGVGDLVVSAWRGVDGIAGDGANDIGVPIGRFIPHGVSSDRIDVKECGDEGKSGVEFFELPLEGAQQGVLAFSVAPAWDQAPIVDPKSVLADRRRKGRDEADSGLRGVLEKGIREGDGLFDNLGNLFIKLAVVKARHIVGSKKHGDEVGLLAREVRMPIGGKVQALPEG